MSDYKYNKPPKCKIVTKAWRKCITSDNRRTGYTDDDFAKEMGTRGSNLQQKLKPSVSENDLTGAEMDYILATTGDISPLEVWANKYRYISIPMDDGEVSNDEIDFLSDEASMSSGEVFKVVKCALKDGVLTEDEKKEALRLIAVANKSNAKLHYSLINSQ